MTTENFENFYNDLVAEVWDSLTKMSGQTWTPRSPEDEARFAEIFRSTGRRMIPLNPRDPELKAALEGIPPPSPSYAGFQLVDVTRLGDAALIAFRWRETGDEIFVHLADMRPFVTEPGSVKWAESIITTNLLERLGGGWYQHHTLRKINGLTFIEDTPAGKQDER